MSDRGELAIVLHTHMPYVEGFGTWPFGEEWLWEAIATSYVPLLGLLGRGAPLTLSLTPVLCDQLEAPDLAERFTRFVEEVRTFTHREDAAGLRAAGHERLAAELDRSLTDYTRAAAALAAIDGDLLGALGRHASWTSAATHAVLPLLASDALVVAQCESGIRSHRRRFGAGWQGGFWLPECAYAPHLEALLARAGVRATCIELTGAVPAGAREHLRPLHGRSGVVHVPIDRATIALAWSADGYPSDGSYRDYHRNTIHHHSPWANDGGAYDHDRALARARAHAADFVGRVRARLRESGGGLPGGGLVVFAIDTELLGHWWYEGVEWLRAVVDECARQDLSLVRLEDARAMGDPCEWPWRMEGADRASSWGEANDLSTWSTASEQVREIAFATRAAELSLLRHGAAAGPAATRQLLAMQASDWPFMLARQIAVPYAGERFAGHREAFEAALREGANAPLAALRNLAVDATPDLLLEP